MTEGENLISEKDELNELQIARREGLHKMEVSGEFLKNCE